MNTNPAPAASSTKVLGYVLLAIGLVLCAIVVVKASVIGYYDSDLPWMLTLSAIGVPVGWLGNKLTGR